MNVGDVIKGIVIAVGAYGNSFVQPVDGEHSNIPIIIEKKLKYKSIYKVRITRITPNFMIGEVEDDEQ